MSRPAAIKRVVGTMALLGATLLCALLFATSSGASYDPVGGGATKLTFDKKFLALMKANGVAVVAKAPAQRRGRAFVFPASEGQMDPTTGKGELHHQGVLVFERDNRRLPFKQVMVKTKRAPLYAKVGGGQLKIATGATLADERSGFGTVFDARGLKLSEKVAVRLNKKLHLGDVFEAGQVIGSLRSETQPETVAILPTGRASLAVDPEMSAKLSKLFVSLNPVSPAELAPGPVFTFPMIRSGAIAPNASLGTLRTGGSIEMLQLGSGQLFWHELWFQLDSRTALAEVNVQPAPPYPGQLGQIPMLDLSPGTVTVNTRTRTIAVSGAALRLQAQSAAHFNQAFAENKEAFKAGELFGTISFVAQAQ